MWSNSGVLLAAAQAPGQIPVVEPLQPLPSGVAPAYNSNLQSGDFASPSASGTTAGTAANTDAGTAASGSPAASSVVPTDTVAVTRAVTPGWGVWAWIVVIVLVLGAVGLVWKRSFNK